MKPIALLLYFFLIGHLGALGHIAVTYVPEREAELAYANAPSCGCKPGGTDWCPTESRGTADCRSFVQPTIIATPVRGTPKQGYTHWVVLQAGRTSAKGAGTPAKAEVARTEVRVSETTREAVRLAKEVHAEFWRDRVTRLRIDGEVFETSAVPSTKALLALGSYTLLVVLGIIAVWVRSWIRRSGTLRRS